MPTEISIPPKENHAETDAGRTFDLFYKPGFAVEMRVFGNNKVVASGYFDSREKFVEWAVKQDATGRDSIYATLNPVDPNLLARQYNVVDRCDGTKDKDVARFRMLLLDFDPKKKSGIPSTDAEKQAAYDKLLDVRTHLLSLGFPEPVIADSGNGYHLLLRVDLPVGDTKLVKGFLEKLNEEFGDDQVGIDTSVHNPARITKVYGTTPRNKGTGTKDRPVRPSKLLDVPAELHEVSRDLLVEVAGDEPSDEPTGYVLRDGKKLDIPDFIERHGIEIQKEDTWDGPGMWAGSNKWIVECPWNGHTDNACHIIQNSEGVISARCKHDSCQGKDWRDFREHYEPGSASKVSRVPVPKYAGTPGTPAVSWLSTKSKPAGGQPFLVADAIPKNFPTAIYGDSGTLKTMLGEHLILSIAAGEREWLGHTINRQTKRPDARLRVGRGYPTSPVARDSRRYGDEGTPPRVGVHRSRRDAGGGRVRVGPGYLQGPRYRRSPDRLSGRGYGRRHGRRKRRYYLHPRDHRQIPRSRDHGNHNRPPGQVADGRELSVKNPIRERVQEAPRPKPVPDRSQGGRSGRAAGNDTAQEDELRPAHGPLRRKNYLRTREDHHRGRRTHAGRSCRREHREGLQAHPDSPRRRPDVPQRVAGVAWCGPRDHQEQPLQPAESGQGQGDGPNGGAGASGGTSRCP